MPPKTAALLLSGSDVGRRTLVAARKKYCPHLDMFPGNGYFDLTNCSAPQEREMNGYVSLGPSMCSAPPPRAHEKRFMAVLFKMQRQRKVRRRMEAVMKMEGSSQQRGTLAFFEAVLARRGAAGRFRVGFRPLAEQVAQPDAGHRIASSCSGSGAG